MNIPISVKNILFINSTVRATWDRNKNNKDSLDEEEFIKLQVCVISLMFGVSKMFTEEIVRDSIEIIKKEQR